jgi:hypothetical protein
VGEDTMIDVDVVEMVDGEVVDEEEDMVVDPWLCYHVRWMALDDSSRPVYLGIYR